MARQYPKFIYQHVTNAKSKGEFVMHLLDPVVLMKVRRKEITVVLDVVQCYDTKATSEDLEPILDAARSWYIATCNPTPEVHHYSNGVSIQTAYNKIMSTRGISNKLGIDRSTVSIIRDKIVKQGKYPSREHMERDLKLCGWDITQHELWELKLS